MDNSIFYSLGNGIKFNKNKYKKEIGIFNGITSHELDKQTKTNNKVHFFKNTTPSTPVISKKDNIKQKKEEEEDNDNDNEESKEDDDFVEDDDNDDDDDDDDEDEENEEPKEKEFIKHQVNNDEEEEDITLFNKSNENENSDDSDDSDDSGKNKNKNKNKKVSKETQEDKHKREIATFRNKHRIKVDGTDIPDPMTEFSQLENRFKVRKYLLNNINEIGYKEPSPIQMQVIPILLKEREVVAIAPTGSGKTASFSIPILQALYEPKKEGFRSVIIAPTRELAQQIYRNFRLLSKGKPFRICVLSKNLHNQSTNENLIKNYDILITTPLRLVYLIKENLLSLNKVEYLVFDEADKLFDKNFQEQVDIVVTACQNPKLKICLFSATMNQQVEELGHSIMKNPIKIIIGEQNAAAITVDQKLIYVGKEEGKLLAVRQLIQKGLEPPILIFTQSKERAHDLFQELIFDGINVDVIHSERTQFQRDTIVKKFRMGKIWVLICTELMARGMDFKGVNFVINFDFPHTLASYIHRIGRTGRAGRPGVAYTLYTDADTPMLPTIVHAMKQSGSHVPDWMLNLKVQGKKKQQYRLKGVERESFSTIPLSERTSSKFKLRKNKKSFNLPGDQQKSNENNNNNNNNNNDNKKRKSFNNNGEKNNNPERKQKQIKKPKKII
ncbi:hypothetical protein DDB_G0274325 [Dictyostelium discoideum AX4]|uniref:Probable ATP-dependent RNA helicase ddx52 n=1 Tax=Dictyostelium discoideum TaxID=44689 RepID=DDX52_DICDI|nr:hypothetical protein DDB_G0274325 [Dictyostelium discoideum AX4]Q86IZ9.1 RecName: Full=Probable ATP-dependent RNA helicase ddx52; AltName: Full=DEAD box protein 52 [Dictyostelium discoideum]EAL70055.1 hypothetical protein DDB_G0274325 [Dictyostelium discoideum AX4]|eukprot:XP_643949.1 hypothetical protein DDB_G0274325 [Dictyostelium discoideum AX4]